jgi:hypothetical protein
MSVLSRDASPLFCARCSAVIRQGEGSSFRVMIEAVADPAPPDLDLPDEGQDLRAEIETLVKQMSVLSEREAMHQVYRRLTIYLCNECYHIWIENPAG